MLLQWKQRIQCLCIYYIYKFKTVNNKEEIFSKHSSSKQHTNAETLVTQYEENNKTTEENLKGNYLN